MDQKNSEYEHFLCSVFDGENFEISVYNLSRADESSENKRGECICTTKTHYPLR